MLALLAAGTGATRVERPIAAELGRIAPRLPVAGDRIGVWRLEREIGRGGMGRVFLAERSDGHFQQRGAVKLVSGAPRAEALARFGRERQLLATLTHRNIARLLDGGATPLGQPFLVMEYVEGKHVDAHCREAELGVRAILKLFVTTCEAVAFAHRRLVVHCDLKPSNLLVDGEGRPVLLDFGIARLLGSVDGETGANEAAPNGSSAPSPAFTPGYASPEQRAHGTVSTGSDVYSLGVMLRELLAGASDRRRLSALQRGELDAIVGRATEDEPARRYAGVDALADDLRAVLDGRPVGALASGPGYALRKTLARRWPILLAAALFVLTVAGFAVRLLQESRRAQAAERMALGERDRAQGAERSALRERDATKAAQADALRQRDGARTAERQALAQRDRAEEAETSSRQVSDFLVSVFHAANPQSEIVEIPTSKLVAEAEARLEKELTLRPATRSDLYAAMAQVQSNLGNKSKALEHFDRAVAIERRRGRPLELARLLDGRRELVEAAFGTLRAEADAREVLALRERWAGAGAHETIEARATLAALLGTAGRTAEAEPLLLKNLRFCERLGPSNTLARALDDLGTLYSRTMRHAEAIALLSRSERLYATFDGESSENYAASCESLARALSRGQRFAEAEVMFRRALEGNRRLFGAESPSAAWSESELARMFTDSGRPREAIPLYQEALAIIGRKLGEESPSYGVMWNNLAFAATAAGDEEATVRAYTRTLEVLGKSFAEKDLARYHLNFGRFLTLAGRLPEAWTQLSAGLATHVANLGEDNTQTGIARIMLAEWYVKSGDAAKAEEQLALARAHVPATFREAELVIGRQSALVLALRGDAAGALRGLEAAEEAERKLWGERDSRTALGRIFRAELLARGTPEQRAAAAALAGEILQAVEPVLVPAAPVLARLRRLQHSAEPGEGAVPEP